MMKKEKYISTFCGLMKFTNCLAEMGTKRPNITSVFFREFYSKPGGGLVVARLSVSIIREYSSSVAFGYARSDVDPLWNPRK